MIKDNNYNNYHIRRWYYHIDETLANENGILANGRIIKKLLLQLQYKILILINIQKILIKSL